MMNCKCHFSADSQANVFDCSGQFSHLPNTFPEQTNWIIMEQSDIISLCGLIPNWTPESNITYVNLTDNRIKHLCSETMDQLAKLVEEVDLRNNMLSSLPMHLIQNKEPFRTLKSIWLSGNPFHCSCDTIPMAEWLRNQDVYQANLIVRDYTNVTCHSGLEIGIAIHKLDVIKMDCIPKDVPMWVVPFSVITGLLLLAGVFLAIILGHHWRQTKLWLYLNFDILSTNDGPEDLTGIQYDALLSFRLVPHPE